MPEILKSTCVTQDGNAPPDWSVVPFAVACARCGQDLHGRSEPTCPGCALTFRWADAVPIEQLTCGACGYHLYGLKEPRCPECATEFTWDEALANYHRQRKPLFEYQWRTKPVRSLFRTWWLALRPEKLWKTLNMHDPVRWRPLFASFLLAVFGLVMTNFMFNVATGILDTIFFYLDNYAQFQARGISFWSDFLEFVYWLTRLHLGVRSLIVVPYHTVCWSACLGLGLLVFQQSMHRQRLRLVHVCRTVVYASIPMCVGMTLVNTVLADDGSVTSLLTSMIKERISTDFYWAPGALVAVVWSAHSVALSYRDYLRMDHPWAVSISAHVIAVMLVFSFTIPLLPYGMPQRVLLDTAEWLGLL